MSAVSYALHDLLVPSFQPLPFTAPGPCTAICLVSLGPPPFTAWVSPLLFPASHPAGLSPCPLAVALLCLLSLRFLQRAHGVETAKWVGWFCRNLQLLALSPGSHEVGNSLRLSESCAYVLSQFPQGDLNSNTVVAERGFSASAPPQSSRQDSRNNKGTNLHLCYTLFTL